MEGNIFTTSIRRGEQTQGKVMETLGEKNFLYFVFFWEEEDSECVRGKLIVMCEEVLFMEENVCKQKAWKEVVCNK